MTLQKIIETVPHALLEKVAEFLADPDMLRMTINKFDRELKLDYLVQDRVKL